MHIASLILVSLLVAIVLFRHRGKPLKVAISNEYRFQKNLFFQTTSWFRLLAWVILTFLIVGILTAAIFIIGG